jgi:formate-dependent nitrite reductase cytochrome c552 subunit
MPKAANPNRKVSKDPHILMKGRIINTLRILWLQSPLRAKALKNARVGPNQYECMKCKDHFKSVDVCVDHIEKVIIPGMMDKYNEDWTKYINRLLLVPVEGLQVLCEDCHNKKTAFERLSQYV